MSDATRQSAEPGGSGLRPSAAELLDVVSDERRRHIVGALCEHGGNLTPAALADRVATRVSDEDRSDTNDAPEHLESQILDCDLPALEAIDLVRLDTYRETVSVTLTEHCQRPTIRLLLEQLHPPDVYGSLLTAMANPRRRSVLAVLTDAEAPLSLAALATRVSRRERDAPDASIPDAEVARMLADLRHVQLPKLLEFDLVRNEDGLLSVTDLGERVQDYVDAVSGRSST